ncbi:metal-dependent hydrolase [Flavihumibacter petaseus]|uniref:Hydrolase n=1 Tax=Flavihumibacter petaseus NBRC 106054 TaxID=1220578 RepID=A0A0E9MU11_9BACT|nr:metal-dependent hydrolase [Flavihumibacter petaseus]GAO41262.1 hypothetical protein FPE01S_01_02740 [Flavihumibacter petaseus NBRC 106054]
MDSVTHIVLGACIGELIAGKQLGKKALLWGAVAQSFPDIDVVAAAWMDLPSELLAHRGFTHSFLFVILFSPVFAWLLHVAYRKLPVTYFRMLLLIGVEMLVHIFLDSFNNYGTGWLEPFSHRRFSWNTIYVADPFLTIAPLVGGILLLMLPLTATRRKRIAAWGCVLPALYLGYALLNKAVIDRAVREEVITGLPAGSRYFTTPAPLNTWLWFVVAGNDSGYYTGYRSVFDRDKITLHYFPSQREWLRPYADRRDVQQLIRFSQEFYTVEKYTDSLVFNDLRFGQVTGWKEGTNPFVFHYFLDDIAANDLVVQRGRLAGWNREVFRSLLRRIKGQK